MRTRIAVTVALVLLTVACSGGDSGKEGDVGGEDLFADQLGDMTGEDSTADAVAPDSQLADGIGDGVADADVEDSDEVTQQTGARAFVSVSEEQLIPGPVSAGVVGDVVMENGVVRFVMRNQEHGLYSPYGGSLVDADRVRDEGEAPGEAFLEMFPMTGLARIFNPNSMTIVDDGSESGTAIVRFEGSDGGMALVDSALPTFPLGIDATVDYILAPEASHLEIKTTLHNPTQNELSVDAGQFLQFSSRTKSFYEGCGEDQDCLLSGSEVGWLASRSGDVSYGVTLLKGKSIQLMLAMDKLFLLSGGSFKIPPDGEVSTRQFFIVGDGTIEDVRNRAMALRDEAPGEEVRVQVSLSDEWTEMDDVWIRVKKTGAEEGSEWVTANTPDDTGAAQFHLEPGVYDMVVSLPGADDSWVSAFEVTPNGENTVSVTANAAGWVDATVTDDEDVPVAAAFALQGGADVPWTQVVVKYVAIRDGHRRIPVPPGEYTVTFSRGLAWSVHQANITVVAGEVTEVVGQIHEAVDTTGFIMMNSHEHSEWSIDSSILAEDRIDNALANGIEVMTATDHDYFGSHQGVIEALGLENQVKSALGCEVSPLWGHTTAAHCSNPPDYPTYFAVEYMLYDDSGKSIRPTTATEIYTKAREEMGCAFLAVNHPYRGGATFTTYDITATSNPKDAEPDLNLHLVDAMEVYNKGDSLDSILNETMPAWFNLLNRGYSIAAIGGSDEHGYRGSYGNPRNMVVSSSDVPGDVDLDELYQNVAAFRSLVMGGPVIRLSVDGKGMGETVVATGGSVEVQVTIEAPEWMGLEFARVVLNGETIQQFTPVVSGEVLRLQETFTVEVSSDAWLIVVAGSTLFEHEMRPVSGKQPLSVTNPVFIDSDGDGYKAIHAEGAPWD